MYRRSVPERRSTSRDAVIAWSLFGLTILFFVPAVGLAATQSLWRFGVANLIWALSVLAFAAAGAVLASRRPDNPVGWFLSLGAALVSGSMLCIEYATRAFLGGGRWPGQEIAGWIGLLGFLIGATLLFPAPTLHFPDGRLPSPGWRWIRRACGVAMIVCLAVLAFAPGTLSLGLLTVAGDTPNPFGLDLPLLRMMKPMVLPLIAAAFVVCFAAPYTRLRRARGAERQQLKWFVYATALMTAGFVAFASLGATRAGQPAGVAVNALSALGFMALPVAIGIAVLKYRLYDIDLVIHRTLVYGTLSLLLAMVYAAGAVLLPVFVPLDEGNDLVVAASTLAVASLFSPLRRRVQTFVDQRFYRARYDAVQTVANFTARLRHDAGVDQMGTALVAVVQQALQPASIGLTMKTPEGDRSSLDPGD